MSGEGFVLPLQTLPEPALDVLEAMLGRDELGVACHTSASLLGACPGLRCHSADTLDAALEQLAALAYASSIEARGEFDQPILAYSHCGVVMGREALKRDRARQALARQARVALLRAPRGRTSVLAEVS